MIPIEFVACSRPRGGNGWRRAPRGQCACPVYAAAWNTRLFSDFSEMSSAADNEVGMSRLVSGQKTTGRLTPASRQDPHIKINKLINKNPPTN